MKQLTVKHITRAVTDAARVSAALDEAAVEAHAIGCVDWPEDYPYTPTVTFRIAHTGSAILVDYRVTEQSVAAVAPHDNGRVWEDSCCEFFFKPEDGEVYYNVECNCAGTLLVGCGPHREGRELASPSLLSGVQRWSSLGRTPFAERVSPVSWQLSLIIPVATAFRSSLPSLCGQRMTANFYKCGDKLQQPHFLSWAPIQLPAPDFHRPDFFGQLLFEP